MNLKDWEKLSPEEQAAHVSPEVEPHPIGNKCSAGLLELRNQLKQEIEEESDASSHYMGISDKLRLHKADYGADTLKQIATEELMHHYMLKWVVNYITKGCGE